MYRPVDESGEQILDDLCRRIPVHFVFGDVPDVMYVSIPSVVVWFLKNAISQA